MKVHVRDEDVVSRDGEKSSAMRNHRRGDALCLPVSSEFGHRDSMPNSDCDVKTVILHL